MDRYKITIIDAAENTLPLKTHLEKDGIDVAVHHLDSAASQESSPLVKNLVLLDITTPHINEFSIFHRILSYLASPMLFVSAKIDDTHPRSGLEAGVHDYIKRLSESRGNVPQDKSALSKRSRPSSTEKLKVGPILINISQHRAMVHNSDLHLTPIEFKLLKILASAPEVVFDRSKLRKHLYKNGGKPGDRAIDCHITNLRKKITHLLPGQRLIHTIYGTGYSFRFPRKLLIQKK